MEIIFFSFFKTFENIVLFIFDVLFLYPGDSHSQFRFQAEKEWEEEFVGVQVLTRQYMLAFFMRDI